MSTKQFFALAIAVVFLAGCQKDGCTDGNATNFDSSADNFDGSCLYEGQVVFWYGENTSNELLYMYSNSLSFYIDGAVVGSTATSQFWTGQPDCGDNSSVTITKDLGGSPALASVYQVIDDYGDTIWSGIINFEANTCNAIELVY